MNRLYKTVGNLPLGEQIALVQRSAMSTKNKKAFMINLSSSDKEAERMVKGLALDGPTQKMLSAFASILRASLHREFMELTNLKSMGEIDEADASAKLEEITDSKENAGRMMNLLKSTAKTIVNALSAVGKTLFKAIKYFTSKGFDLLKWIFNHPSTVMWLTYTGVYLKKKSCEFISIKIYGDPEIVEVGLLARSSDFKKYTKEQSQKIAGFVKRQFLSYAYTFVDSSSFTSVISNVSTVIETGLLYVLAMIPVYGPILALSIKTSGGLSVVLSSLGFVIREAMYYGFTAMMVKEAGQDFYEIISGTCVKRPEEQHKLTLKAIQQESAEIYKNVSEGTTSKAKDLTKSFNTMIKTGFNSIFS